MTIKASTPQTRWSLIATAGQRDAEGHRARDELCKGYRFPVYAHLRRSGHGPGQAAALGEDFFTQLKTYLGSGRTVLPDRFRHFLFEKLQQYLASEPAIEVAEIDSDWGEYEQRLQSELPFDGDSELAFTRNFAEELTQRAFQRLRLEAGYVGHEELFDALAPYIKQNPGSGVYESLSRQTGLSGSSLAMALRRLRRRLRELVIDEIGQTLDSPESIAEEQASLAEALWAEEEPS